MCVEIKGFTVFVSTIYLFQLINHLGFRSINDRSLPDGAYASVDMVLEQHQENILKKQLEYEQVFTGFMLYLSMPYPGVKLIKNYNICFDHTIVTTLPSTNLYLLRSLRLHSS